MKKLRFGDSHQIVFVLFWPIVGCILAEYIGNARLPVFLTFLSVALGWHARGFTDKQNKVSHDIMQARRWIKCYSCGNAAMCRRDDRKGEHAFACDACHPDGRVIHL